MAIPRVVLFTRYPEPGRAKTRLIPALGPEGAAALHRRLTEHTLAAVRASDLPHELRVTGAPPDAFLEWLGPVEIADQGEGDLGERLERAGPPYPTLFIGADAPDLSADLLVQASQALLNRTAVIGPAEDGGYWLLGLAQPITGIFRDIAWSSDRVFNQTISRLAATGVTPELLPRLSDCDRPEDLERWPGLTT
ncbi:TIGR04282 family arsenosugar biosynthesis glycosyltransferase [Sphingomonas sp. TREG-RG-20F-R18-01]|uniref:TIGR04282 family arsenosugar biosynthesis glycosyltransferase n=1 Tax=Sphingomonas sp. TREG-RG-20F-R18-01 TaxID=2914982 RepID=UPI001F5944E7|nr:TIGR04282 family arsenosugar biosynthesis glycosyltransferase [Sphingomonas sp. TREG-RG-20F-R18-01]